VHLPRWRLPWSWPVPMATVMEALRKRFTDYGPTSSFLMCASLSETSLLHHLPAQQDRASPPHGSAAAVGGAHSHLGRRGHGFRRRLTTVEWQIGDPQSSTDSPNIATSCLSVICAAHLFFDNIMKLHGIPSSIVSDQGPVFTRNFWQELFKLTGVKLQMSSVFHP
jgi:hypothetical protein